MSTLNLPDPARAFAPTMCVSQGKALAIGCNVSCKMTASFFSSKDFFKKDLLMTDIMLKITKVFPRISLRDSLNANETGEDLIFDIELDEGSFDAQGHKTEKFVNSVQQKKQWNSAECMHEVCVALQCCAAM